MDPQNQSSSLSEAATPQGWGADPAKVEEWFARQTIKRDYKHDVLDRLDRLNSLHPDLFDVQQYGTLSHNPERYPLKRVLTKNWDPNNPTIIITGGVHGYEPSGITGALRFLEEVAPQYADKVNFVVYPCVSPLGYEIDHRWNRKAIDPNRHFIESDPTDETAAVMASIKATQKELLADKRFAAAIDLHETVDRDKELRAERDARDGTMPKPGDEIIPQGFYLCTTRQEDVSLGQKIVEAVSAVTPICGDEKILDIANQEGVIVVDMLNTLCQNFMSTVADVAMTTEIYPDKATDPTEAERAQVAAVRRLVEHVLQPTNG
jgi:hypothetical protein